MEDQTLNEYLEAINTINRLSPVIAALGIDAGLSIKVHEHVTTNIITEPMPIYQALVEMKGKPKSEPQEPKRVYRTIDGKTNPMGGGL